MSTTNYIIILIQIACYQRTSLDFAPFHSTVTALLHLTNDWYLNIDKGENSLIELLDLAKAFDTVSHEILLKKA